MYTTLSLLSLFLTASAIPYKSASNPLSHRELAPAECCTYAATNSSSSCANVPVPIPAVNRSFADPSITYHAGKFYSFATSHSGKQVQLAISQPASSPEDASIWTYSPKDVIADNKLPSWIAPTGGDSAGIWAPDVVQLPGGGWVMYVSARVIGKTDQKPRHCIGAARADDIEGPYTIADHALFCAANDVNNGPNGAYAGSSIDANAFIDPKDHSMYLYYRQDTDNGTHSRGSSIWVQQVKPEDGTTLIGKPKRLLSSGDCDLGTVEAPSVVRVQDKIVLFFSTGGYFDRYTVSMATSDSPMGDFVRRDSQVLGRGKPWGGVDDGEQTCKNDGVQVIAPNGGQPGNFRNPGGATVVPLPGSDGSKLGVAYHAYDDKPSESDNRKLYTALWELQRDGEHFRVRMTWEQEGKRYVVEGL